MSRYKLENKSIAVFSCEVCGRDLTQSPITMVESVNEFHKDGTVKIHYSCSSHIVDLFKKIIKK
jgi:hypothetical protein